MARAPSSTPAPGPKGASLPARVPIEWMIEHGYASEIHDRFGAKIPGVGVSVSPSDDRMIFHFTTGKRAPANFPEGSPGAAQFGYKPSGTLAERAIRAAFVAGMGEEAIAA